MPTIILPALIALLLAGPALAQDPDEVAFAVEHCIGMDPLAQASRSQLQDWGDAVLPQLQAMLPDTLLPTQARRSLRVLSAIGDVRTPAAVDVLLQHVEGVAPSMQTMFANTQLYSLVQHPELSARVDSPRLEAYVASQAASPAVLAHDRSAALEVIAHFRWADQLDLARSLLDDPNRDLRVAAAEVVTALTGLTPDLPATPARFPATALEPELLQPLDAGVHATAFGHASAFGPDDNGTPSLVISAHRQGLVVLQLEQDRLVTRRVLPLEGMVNRLLSFADEDGFMRVAAVLQPEPRERVSALVLLDGVGGELFRVPVEHDYSPVLVPLVAARTGARGGSQGAQVVGLVTSSAGSTSLQAFDLEGGELWSGDSPRTVLGKPSWHPALPGLLDVSGMGRKLIDIHGEEVKPGGDTPGGALRRGLHTAVSAVSPGDSLLHFSSHSVLCPDPDGQPGLVDVTRDVQGTHSLKRRDQFGHTLWEGTLPARPCDLALLESRSGRRLLLVPLTDGQLLVVDDQGTLLDQRQIFDPEQHGYNGSVYASIAAGPLGDGDAVVLDCSSQRRLYWLGP